MDYYELKKQATPGPWGSASGVVTCKRTDGEHIGSFHTNTLIKDATNDYGTPLVRKNGPASAALAAHCVNNFDKALALCDELLDKALDLAQMAETNFAEDFADYRARILQLETVEDV